MNTPILATELPLAERKRRAALRKRNEQTFAALGFKKVSPAGETWWHPNLLPGVQFDWSSPARLVDFDEVIESVFEKGRRSGADALRGAIKTLLNIRQD